MASSSFGPLLVGSWLDSIAYAAVLQQSWRYFSSCQTDKMWLKSLVAVVVLLDTVNIVAQYGYVYLVTVTFEENAEELIRLSWPTPFMNFTSPFITTFVNSFLVYRFYGLSKNRIFSAFLAFILIADLGLAMFVGYGISFPPTTVEGGQALIDGIIAGTVLYSAIDALIAACVLWQLMKMRTQFQQTRAMISRLMRLTVESGAGTFLVSLIILIIFLANPNLTFVTTSISWLISHFYTLTLLFNLNVREKLRGASGTRSHSDSRNRGLSLAAGIHVTQHKTTITDPEQGYDMQDVSGKAPRIGEESGFE